RGGAVDLVREEQAREHRTGPELERARGRVEHRRAGDVGGQQVGRALQAREVEPEGGGERPGGECLAQSRYVLEQDVPAREDRGERRAQRVPHADGGGADLGEHALAQGRDLRDGQRVGGGRGGGGVRHGAPPC